MSHKFDFDLTHKIIRARVEGVVTDESLKEYYATVSKYGRRHPTFSGICDMSAVSFVAISAETVRTLAKLPPAIPNPDIPRCIVAGSPAMFGMARMFELEGGETRPNLHVVRSEREAFAILGIIKPKFGSVEPKR
ncbi:MAG: hypothetical protein ABSC71_14240 [Candidatus Acidiferrales bacterium]|jgi:hypothetical protein